MIVIFARCPWYPRCMKHIIIDTREPSEFAASHVDGALNISARDFITGTLPSQLVDVPRDQSIIVYCRTGARSNTVGHILRSHGFTVITNGINEHHVAKLLAHDNA